MNKLVFVQDKQVVTDSLTVAEVFGKEHKHVKRDIRQLNCSEEFYGSNFGLINYQDVRGRTQEKYIISEQGFTLLVMGYSGMNAMQFKEQYINEFNHMHQQLRGTKILSDREQRMESMRLTLETAEKQERMDTRLSDLEAKVEEQITLYHGEQRRLQRAVGSKVYSLTSDKEYRKSLFSELHREIKDRFGVSSYKDIKRKDMQTAINYIENWIPKKVS
ncbi:Rha family transcriptional regulator [Virgibacillus ndiopensis]|uniref:Rha family transcriptional regulator n=1 Tax=Virgibacillus ndiopensis TaxID=2004408 RepID=UPI000C069DC9|nr:Rha family transcriptional regulator [Virgibacillus ndiopensis]